MSNTNAQSQEPPTQFQAGSLRSIFEPRQTRSGSYYSPYLLSSDVYADPNVTVDALLYTALNLLDDPFASPLTTPPSSPCASPEPSPFPQLPPEVTIPVQVEPQEGSSEQTNGGLSKKKRKRRGKKKGVVSREEAGSEETAKEAGKGELDEESEERPASGKTQQRSH
ncbi:hypothetical protein V5O48_007559, partial [Marasmius crinis-equi]